MISDNPATSENKNLSAEAEDILVSKPPQDLFSSDSDSIFEAFSQNYKEYAKYEEKVLNILVHPVSEEASGRYFQQTNNVACDRFFINLLMTT